MTGQRLRIGMVLDQPFPPDARVEREASALAAAGFEVHLLCAAEKKEGELREEAYRGFYIHRVDPDAVYDSWFGIHNRLRYTGLIKNISREFYAVDTAWQTLIDRFVRGYGIQALHIHDLRLVPSGQAVADKYRLPLVADLHENYPALMQMFKGRHNPEKGRKQRRKWEAIEARSVQTADRVIVVIEEARERLIRQGAMAGKVMVLPNTVDKEKFEAAPIDMEVVRQFKPFFTLTYVGHLNDNHRGIQTVLEAMGLLKHEIPELAFIGAGAIKDAYRERLEKLIQENELEGKVFFTGWLDETGFATYIEAADLCLIPHLANEHTHSTFPNKAYLYHLFKRPLITSDCRPLVRYIEEDTQGGLIFESGNAQALAERIRQLYCSPELRRQLAHNGYHAVAEKHNWAQTARRLVGLYEGLFAQTRLI